MNQILQATDFFRIEVERFREDIVSLILGVLDTSLEALDTRAHVELAGIEQEIKPPKTPVYREHLEDELGDVTVTSASQIRYLTNMAFVALVSRLTHALRRMAKLAETFSPRKEWYAGKSEFISLWREYGERFGIDFDTNADKVQFVKTMVDVRNQIVHQGGEARPFKYLYEVDLRDDIPEMTNSSFAEAYPTYVSGQDVSAEVSVSREQLNEAIDASIELVEWLAGELRRREVTSIEHQGNRSYGV